MEMKTIHSDDRGDINLILGSDLCGLDEITIFTTKKGHARGGCIHLNSNEHCCLIAGEVEYFVGDFIFKCKPGDPISIPRNTPHYFVAKTDSVMAEWGASPEEKKNKHLETRKIVDEINEKLKK